MKINISSNYILVRFSLVCRSTFTKNIIVFEQFYQAQNLRFKMFIIFSSKGEEAMVKVTLPHAST